MENDIIATIKDGYENNINIFCKKIDIQNNTDYFTKNNFKFFLCLKADELYNFLSTCSDKETFRGVYLTLDDYLMNLGCISNDTMDAILLENIDFINIDNIYYISLELSGREITNYGNLNSENIITRERLIKFKQNLNNIF